MSSIFAFAPPLQVLVARAREKGVGTSARIEPLVEALTQAAKKVFGADRSIEIGFDEVAGAISAMAVVKVGRAPGEASPDDVAAALGPGFEEGDEALIDLEHFDPPTWALLGLEDAERVHQVWLAESGRARLEAFPEAHASMLDLAVELGDRLEVPSLERSLEVLTRFLEAQAPAARATYAGTPSDDLGYFRELGDATGELVRLLEAIGPVGAGDWQPFFGGSPLLTAERARAMREMLDGLEADGEFGRWEPNTWWNPAWVPFFGDDVSLRCIDLQGGDEARRGQVVAWANDAPERPVEAPSVAAWIGLIALGVLAGVLVWDDELGIHEPFTPHASFEALRRRLLPGYPDERSARERAG